MKLWLKRLFVLIVIILLISTPYILFIDFKRNSPFVLVIWILSFAYYIHINKKKGNEEKELDTDEKN